MSRHIAWITQSLFIVSFFSGFIVVFAYHPSLAYDSVQKIEYILPYGLFFRELHYFSSEAFVVSLLLHIVIEVSKKEIKISFNSWFYSILAFFITLILMFTGFVLKGDQSANSAAQIAFSLIKETPFLDNFLMLFKDTTLFYWKFFIWHIVFLPSIILFAIFKHVKKITTKIEYLVISLGISLLISLILNMPEDIALEKQVLHLKGPWFFWGAENLLELDLSAMSINLTLLLPFVLLMLLYKRESQKAVKILLIFWTILYAYFSF